MLPAFHNVLSRSRAKLKNYSLVVSFLLAHAPAIVCRQYLKFCHFESGEYSKRGRCSASFLTPLSVLQHNFSIFNTLYLCYNIISICYSIMSVSNNEMSVCYDKISPRYNILSPSYNILSFYSNIMFISYNIMSICFDF